MKTYLSPPALVCAGAKNSEELYLNLINTKTALKATSIENKTFILGEIQSDLEKFPSNTSRDFFTRTNQILFTATLQIDSLIRNAIKKFGKSRIGVVIGTTTTGVEENFQAFKTISSKGFNQSIYVEKKSSLSNPAEFLAKFYGLDGVCFGISTACTSSLKAIIEAKGLIQSDLCDAVICGGVDSLNTLTIMGFESLKIIDTNLCLPMSKNRNGINIGEGAGVFLLSKEPISSTLLKGYASNNDAYHITSPNSDGKYQKECIQSALEKADLKPKDLDYIHLHGTGTIENDKAEAHIISEIFPEILVSSSKSIIGHTLAASGSIGAGICAFTLNKSRGENEILLPPHFYDDCYDSSLPSINLVKKGISKILKNTLILSFAFGGDNAALILGVES